jgi:phosphoglycerate dehydrogenase-like enzyme
MENVILTPHVSGGTPHYFARTADLFTENLKRYLTNEPLENLYDPTRGY